MRRSVDPFILLIALVMTLRLLSMYILPLTDTTEARYAAIAQLMVSSNDWITPWYTPDRPFWGKPPLAFWAQALSMKLLGGSAFAARFPSWLATLATLGLLYTLALNWFGRRVAGLATLIYASTILVFVASGAVLTDTFLGLGICWSLVGFALATPRSHRFWRYAPFLGLVVGLLAKGPLAIVLIGVPIVIWGLTDATARERWNALPWISGLFLTASLTLPWYVAAELKTPGFLHYFLWGEHVQRFIDPGWVGDLYGNGHARAKGMIWLFWLEATFPWSLLALLYSGRALLRFPAVVRIDFSDGPTLFLWAWAIATPLFFTVASNILWTYVLPAIGPFAILLAHRLTAPKHSATDHCDSGTTVGPMTATGALLVPLVSVLLTMLAVGEFIDLKSERDLVAAARKNGLGSPLLFVDHRPTYSARFYGAEQVDRIDSADLSTYLANHSKAWLVITEDTFEKLQHMPALALEQRFKSKRYILVQVALKTHRDPLFVR